jgi:type I restriction enzyme M protein
LFSASLGDKKAAPRFQRNLEDGSYIVGDEGERLLASDFASALTDLRSSKAIKDFSWLVCGMTQSKELNGWSVAIRDVLSDPDLTIDPKRYCSKFIRLRTSLAKTPHFLLGEVVDFISEKTTSTGHPAKRITKKQYEYIEIQDIGYGDFKSTSYRGWELPDRAKHFAEARDLYIGSIWGSVAKWCLIPDTVQDVIVTNGCHRLRIKQGKETLLPDLVAFLCTEAYAVQMRALARGSDGLAEVTEDDVARVIIPELSTAARVQVKPYVDSLVSGTPDVKSKVSAMFKAKDVTYPQAANRPSHVVLV